ncbi:MAG TPA: DUF5667 domain-containing protein [Candidatus Paceibacterota bacterium]
MPERILKKATEARLTDAEKAQIRQNLVSFMAQHPAQAVRPVRSPFTMSFFSIRRLAPAALILVLALSCGTAFAANSALPGDALYSVKINVNENVESFLAFGAEANAKIKTSQAARRLEEAERLAVMGKLDVETKAAIESRFASSVESASKSIKKLKQTGGARVAVAISSDLETSLAAHQQVLNGLSDGAGRIGASAVALESIAGEVGRRLTSITETRVRAEALASNSGDQAKVRSSAEASLAASEEKIEAVRKFVGSQVLRERIAAEAGVAANAQINEAAKLVAEGRAKMNAGLYGEAFVALKTAHRSLQGTQALVGTLAKAGIRTGTSYGIASTASTTGTAAATAVLMASPATSSPAGSHASVSSSAKVNVSASAATATADVMTAVPAHATTSVASVAATSTAAATSALFSAPAAATVGATVDAAVNTVIEAITPVASPANGSGINNAVSGLKK